MNKQRAMREGVKFWEEKNTQVSCAGCGSSLAASSLNSHMERSHGISIPHTRGVDVWGGGGDQISDVFLQGL